MIWATVSSQSCFCWLYRVSPTLAAKNIINLISVLTIWPNSSLSGGQCHIFLPERALKSKRLRRSPFLHYRWVSQFLNYLTSLLRDIRKFRGVMGESLRLSFWGFFYLFVLFTLKARKTLYFWWKTFATCIQISLSVNSTTSRDKALAITTL